MIIAVPVNGKIATGPGEAREIAIVDTVKGTVLETYPNPALMATSARGISMVRSAMERNAEALVVGGIGEHALSYASNHMKVFNGSGLTLEDIMVKFPENQLEELLHATHSGHHDHHH